MDVTAETWLAVLTVAALGGTYFAAVHHRRRPRHKNKDKT